MRASAGASWTAVRPGRFRARTAEEQVRANTDNDEDPDNDEDAPAAAPDEEE